MKKSRLDVLMFNKGLLESRHRAGAAIMSGAVYVNGIKALKPGMQVKENDDIQLLEMPKYVSRGGYKLEKALDYFSLSVEGRVCIDCGASTGGFTDCLLQRGAKLVYAVDVGYGQLAWSIRNNPNVIVMEKTNIRYVSQNAFPLRPDFAVADLSFISLKLVLPVLRKTLSADSYVVCLVKPQFEAGKDKVGKNGIVRDINVHKSVLDEIIIEAEQVGFTVKGMTYSPIKGARGNIEYLCVLESDGGSDLGEKSVNIEAVVINAQEYFAHESRSNHALS